MYLEQIRSYDYCEPNFIIVYMTKRSFPSSWAYHDGQFLFVEENWDSLSINRLEKEADDTKGTFKTGKSA